MVSSNLRPHPVSFSAGVVSASASRVVLLPDETVQETAELFIRAVSPQIIGRSLVRHHSVVHKKDLIRDFHRKIHFMRYYQHTAPLLVGQILNDR